jgi:hypothetical protein
MPDLPERADVDQLRRKARELLRAAVAGEPGAQARLRAVSERPTLAAAQLAIAREHGFRSWPALRSEAKSRQQSTDWQLRAGTGRSAIARNPPKCAGAWSAGTLPASRPRWSAMPRAISGAVLTRPWTPSAARCSSPLFAACGSTAGWPGSFSAPEPQADFPVAEIYNRQLHLTGLASVFMDGADVARIFDQLRPLFDRGLLTPRP